MLAELNQRLEEARKAYYAGAPIMSDADFDLLEAELKGLAGDAQPSVLTTVGTDAPGRIPHKHPMRSIENVYSVEEAVRWVRKFPHYAITLAPKYDGVSCSLTFEQGKLTKAVTRGDGDAGESILPQVLASPHIRSFLPVPLNLEIRGELVIHRSTLLELNREIEAAGGKPFVSTRNLVAGTMKLKDLGEVRKRSVHFMPWEVLSADLDTRSDGGSDSAFQRLQDLRELGFREPTGEIVTTPEELDHALSHRWVGKLEEKDPEIGLDGIVIKIDSCAKRRELGYGSKFSNFQIAFKAQNAKTETTLKEVIWQVGRQGRLTPVGIVEPVQLAGATIERVMLNNLTWIEQMGLKLGSRVMLMRSGDVIPKIVEVLE